MLDVDCGFWRTTLALPPVDGMLTTAPPPSYEGSLYAMRLGPSIRSGSIVRSLPAGARHFSLPVFRSNATTSFAPLFTSVGRYSVLASAAVPTQPWRSRSMIDRPHSGWKLSFVVSWERRVPSCLRTEMFQDFFFSLVE